MRQGQQQHRRGRNRGSNNNNNRKGQNPLTRNFESSGPDVKIRGTPAHVAEKYMSLARDALSAGDPVLAENYLQHAEHYNRIILAFREQQTQNSPDAQNGAGRQQRDVRDSSEDADDISGDEGGEEQARIIQPGDPQPSISAGEGQSRTDRGEGRRQPRQRGGNGSREGREQREGRSQPRDQRRRERQRFGESDQQPDFLRRPVRRPREDGDDVAAEASEAPAPAAAEAGPDQE